LLLRVADRSIDGQLDLRVTLGLEDDVVDFFERQSAQSNTVPLNHLVACTRTPPVLQPSQKSVINFPQTPFTIGDRMMYNEIKVKKNPELKNWYMRYTK